MTVHKKRESAWSEGICAGRQHSIFLICAMWCTGTFCDSNLYMPAICHPDHMRVPAHFFTTSSSGENKREDRRWSEKVRKDKKMRDEGERTGEKRTERRRAQSKNNRLGQEKRKEEQTTKKKGKEQEGRRSDGKIRDEVQVTVERQTGGRRW